MNIASGIVWLAPENMNTGTREPVDPADDVTTPPDDVATTPEDVATIDSVRLKRWNPP